MTDDPNLWRAIAGARSPEVWIALFAGTLYVYRKSPHPSRLTRGAEAGISGMIGYSVGPDAAAWAGVNEAFAVITLSSLGYLLLDVATSIVADRAVLRDILIRRLGGGKNE
ncbi:hypothetical protein [uncultured Paracoccus sp.]|uniref:hypothetical protein n=1 Tax=uncultured Paracoccus sp. TaxID=189685 RepID=UPI0025E721ED|nr:hypothetical protein [uncultured Paracoccus sp.]